jgi:type VI secretion system protein
MSLVLTVLGYRGQPMAQPLSQRFDAPSVTVGRAPDNDWTLPDPDQLISKHHCAIRLQGGRYTITDTSTNGVFINGSPQPVGNGRSEPLADGDHLQVGEYEILVKLEGVSPGLAPPLPQPAPAARADDPFGLGSFDFTEPAQAGPAPLPPIAAQPPPAPFSSGFPPPASGGFPPAGEDPFAAAPAPAMQGFAAPPQGAPLIPEGPDWLLPPSPPAGEIAADQYAQADHLASEHVQFTPPTVARAPGPIPAGPIPTGPIPAGAIPDNWNPLGEPAAPVIPPLQPPIPTQMPPAAPVVVERMPQRGVPAAQPPVPGGFPPSPLPADAGGFAQAAPVPAFDTGALATAPVMPRPPVAPPVAAARPAQPTLVAAGAEAGNLLAAFLEGAGIDPTAVADQNPAELMALAGRLLHDMAAGLRDALSTRAMIKAEYRVEQTVIRAANNNPLKFSVDLNQLLAALLSRGRPGYLAGPEAVSEGFKDLRVHELALLGGMQQAVAALLRQFDPEQLKQRLEQQSLLQNLLPAARKAKYWEIYEEHYKQIAADVSEDVRGTFGRAFASAYEEQARKL